MTMPFLDQTLDQARDLSGVPQLRRSRAMQLACLVLVVAGAVVGPRLEWPTARGKKKVLPAAASPSPPAQPSGLPATGR